MDFQIEILTEQRDAKFLIWFSSDAQFWKLLNRHWIHAKW